MSGDPQAVPSRAQCEAVLRAAGIDEPLARVECVPGPDYATNIVCILNDRYVLRASTHDGERRVARERRALDRLRDIPEVPRVLGEGTISLGEPAHYLLQTRIPGDTVISQWPETSDAGRRRLIEELAGVIRQVHARPAEGYAIGFYGSALRGWRGGWLDGHDVYVTQQLAAIRTRPLTDDQAGLVDDAERFYAAHRDALASCVGPRMAHGDLHLYNVLASEGHITGIIDWEWSYGGGVEPDFDLEGLVRWALYPGDLGDDDDDPGVTADDFAGVIPTLLAAYPEVAAVPRLAERMTIYQIEHELHHMIAWPQRVPTRPTERLAAWVRDQRLLQELG